MRSICARSSSRRSSCSKRRIWSRVSPGVGGASGVARRRAAGLGAQPERAADALDVDAEHARALAAAPEGGDREPREVAHRRLVAVADRLQQLLAQVVEVDLLAAGDPVLVLGARPGAPCSRTPWRIAASSAARKKKRSKTRSNTRRSSGDFASVAASASRNAGSSVQLTSPSAANASSSSEVPTATPSARSSSAKRDDAGREPLGHVDEPTPELDADALGDHVEVGAVLDDDRQRRAEDLGRDVVGAEQQQRARPVDRLRDRGRLLEVELAHHLDDLDEPLGRPSRAARARAGARSRARARLGVVEPQVQAAALERLGQLARVVRGQQHDRVRARLDAAELGDRDLEVREQLEQHRLELLVGLVDLVDQQHDRLGRGDRGHQRPLEQELLAEDVVLDRVPARALGLGLDAQQLLAVVPLVQRLGLVEPLVALQAHEPAVEVLRQRLRQLGLADARRALDEHRLAEPGGQEGDQRGGLARQVADGAQAGGDILDRSRFDAHAAQESRRASHMLAARAAGCLRPLTRPRSWC